MVGGGKALNICLSRGRDSRVPGHFELASLQLEVGFPHHFEAEVRSAQGRALIEGCSRPLLVACAGVTCDGWSTAGSRRRFSHGSELCHAVFVAERKARARQGVEDLVFVECTPQYPADVKLQDPLSDTHRVVWIRTGPECLGYPVHRMRLFAAALNLDTARWAGPSQPEDIQRDFAKMFYRSCSLCGDALFVAPHQERLLEYQALCAVQANHVSLKALSEMATDDLMPLMLSAGQLRLFQERRRRLGSGSMHIGAGGPPQNGYQHSRLGA